MGSGAVVVELDEPAPLEYAGLFTRMIGLALDALLIDILAALISGAVVIVRSLLSVAKTHDNTVLVLVGSILYVIWVIGYFVGFWTTTGQTVGNRLMQIRVTRTNGATLLPRQALVRLFGMVISMPFLWGYFPVLTSPRRRAICDVMAGTVVIIAGPGRARVR